ncbi:MAG TPA: prepilin-type N-terminal cleavage/methylation domain-containing protein [Cellvibrionaceae bacterium]
MMTAQRGYRPQQGGFSLLEMVVAVAILGLSLGMLYQAAGGATRSISTSEDYSYAVVMAQSLLALHSEVSPDGVNSSGATDDGYEWEVVSQPYLPDNGMNDEGTASLHWIDVRVSWGSFVRPREFTLHSAVPVSVVPSDQF